MAFGFSQSNGFNGKDFAKTIFMTDDMTLTGDEINLFLDVDCEAGGSGKTIELALNPGQWFFIRNCGNGPTFTIESGYDSADINESEVYLVIGNSDGVGFQAIKIGT